MALLKDLWHFDQSRNPALFYGKFNSLNNFFDSNLLATPAKLKEIQIKTLQAAYKQKESYKKLNNFIVSMMGKKIGTEEDLFAQLVNGINRGLGTVEQKSGALSKEEYIKKVTEIINQIEELVNNTAGTEGIQAPSLKPIEDAIGEYNYDQFIAEKGKYLEDLGAWVMRMAGLQGFTTGSWQASDAFFGEEKQNSIIEDAMGLILGDTLENASDNFIQIKVQGYNQANRGGKQRLDKKLQQWIDSIKELNGLKVLNGLVTVGTNIDSVENFVRLINLIDNNSQKTAGIKFSILLSDNLYKQIQKISVNMQGKSNTKRHLTNDGSRQNYIIKSEYKYKYYSQLLAFSKTDPIIKQTAVSLEEQQTKYREFAAYVNYNLSHDINNTIYGRNEFYLTKEGFSDLATLMQKRNFYIRIKDLALSYEEFLNNSFITIYS